MIHTAGVAAPPSAFAGVSATGAFAAGASPAGACVFSCRICKQDDH
jgi:hypothetical protein